MEISSETNTIYIKNHEVAVLQDKLLSALGEISQESFSVSDDTILEKMYVHLENSTDIQEILGSCLAKITDWVDMILIEWHQDKIFYDVKKFALRFIGLFGSFQNGFESLKLKGSLQVFEKVVTSEEVQRDASMFVPSMMSLKMLLNHVQGVRWVSETGIWKSAVAGYHKGRSIYAKRVCVEFLSTLLWKSSKLSDGSCKEVLALICKPLLEENLINIEGPKLTDVSDKAVPEQKLESASNRNDGRILIGAEFLCDLLNHMFCSCEIIKKLPFSIQMTVVNNVVQSESNEEKKEVETIKLITDVMLNCSSIQALETFAKLVLLIDLTNSFVGTANQCPLLQLYCHADAVLCDVLLVKEAWNSFINHCVLCLSWYHKVKVVICNCQECYFFQSGLVNHLFGYLWPLTKYTHFIATSSKNLKRTEDIIQVVETKGCRSRSSYQSAQIYFASLGVSGLSRSFKFIFQPKIVKDIYDVFAKTLKSAYHLVEWTHTHDSLCIDILTMIIKTVDENHSFFLQSCQESSDTPLRYIIKIIRLRSVVEKTRVVVTLLQTLMVIIRINGLHLANHSTHMKPLLVFADEITLLETLLNAKSWEIRDSTLEVFQTMMELSEIASWLFDNMFKEPLLKKIFSLAVDDGSSYVRASALIFFAKSGKLRMFSDNISPSLLVEQALSSVIDDTMPVVRRAACELISAFYISDISTVDKDQLCKTMFSVIAKDLDWEVKTKSLQFWRCVIDKIKLEKNIPLDVKCLYFLKLSKEEVTSQLVKLLRELGDKGCLKAVWVGLNDECDLKVAEEAYSIVSYLQGLDEQWAFTETISKTEEETEPFDPNLQNIKLHPKEFFHLLKTDNWQDKLNSRKNWIENSCDDLQTILDHILNVDNKIDDWDHNVVDCD